MPSPPLPKRYNTAEYGTVAVTWTDGEFVRFTPLTCPTGFTSMQVTVEEFWDLVSDGADD